jgi:peptide/nickel transport system substrate-binding protein
MRWVTALLVGLLAFAGPLRAQPRGSVVIGMSQFPPDMHPFITSTSVRNVVLLAMNRPMMGTRVDGSPFCVLCTEIPTLENGGARLVRRDDGSLGMVVTYTLKPDLFWGDGARLTARDIAFSLKVNFVFSPPQFIDAVAVPDDLHLELTLRSPVYDYPRLGSVFVLPEHIEGPIFAAARDPLEYGTRSAFNRRPEEPGLWFGPYRVKRFEPNNQITMVPNEHWQGVKPYFREVTFRLIENTAALQANLLSGDVDTVMTSNMGLTLDQTLGLSRTQQARFEFDFRPSLGSTEHLAVNVDNPLLADKRARRALSMAIDRETIVKRLFDNKFQATTLFLHPTEQGFDPSVKGWPYDPKAARALLAELGYRPGADGILVDAAGRRFSVDLTSTSGNRVRELVGQVLQTQMKAVGVELVIKNEPARVMFGESLRKRSFSGLVEYDGGAGIDALPIDMYSTRYIPSAENAWAGRNYGGYRSDAMDAALLAARAELDPVARRQRWRRVLEIYADDVPSIPLFFAATAVITPKWLQNLNRADRVGYFTGWIEEWRPR